MNRRLRAFFASYQGGESRRLKVPAQRCVHIISQICNSVIPPVGSPSVSDSEGLNRGDEAEQGHGPHGKGAGTRPRLLHVGSCWFVSQVQFTSNWPGPTIKQGSAGDGQSAPLFARPRQRRESRDLGGACISRPANHRGCDVFAAFRVRSGAVEVE